MIGNPTNARRESFRIMQNAAAERDSRLAEYLYEREASYFDCTGTQRVWSDVLGCWTTPIDEEPETVGGIEIVPPPE